MSIDRSLMGFDGELHGLLGMFVPSQVVFFSVMNRGGPMRLGRTFMKFSSSNMRVIWHYRPLLSHGRGSVILT